MKRISLLSLVVLAGGALPLPAVLVSFTSRSQFQANTTLGTGLLNSNGVNFTGIATCPSNSSTSNSSPCPAAATTYSDYTASGAGMNVTLLFNDLLDFTVQGFTTSTGSHARLILFSPNYSYNSAARGVLKYDEPVLSTRNTFDVTGTTNSTSTIRMRINLPTGTNSFAIDLANGCNIRGTGTDAFFLNPTTGCDAGDNHAGTLNLNFGLANNTQLALPVLSTTDTAGVGNWNFVGVWSDAQNISWVDITMPAGNYGSIFATRIAYGHTVAIVPEASTLALTAAGLIAAGAFRRRCRKPTAS